MKKISYLLFLIFVSNLCSGQTTIGISEIRNYTKSDFKAGLQTWDITQAENGTLFMANNEGLLTFDGIFWNLFPLPNKTIVRSVCVKDQKIYVGGQDEIGYFVPSMSGELSYHSLNTLVPKRFAKFNDIWDISYLGDKIYFRTAEVIFILRENKIQTITAPSNFTHLAKANGRMFAADKEKGFFEIVTDQLKPAINSGKDISGLEVSGIVRLPSTDTLIVSTLNDGIYYLVNKTLIPFPLEFDALKQASIYNMTLVNNQIVLATNEIGVLIFDLKGNLTEHLNKNNGLQTNNCLSIFADKEKNLWIGLNNGIDYVNISSSIRQIKPLAKDGAGYSATIYKDNLFLGTSDGLYAANITANKYDFSYARNSFKAVKNSEGQVWKVKTINDHLLIGKHQGAYEYVANELKPLSRQTGFWNFLSTPTSDLIIAGNYEGLQFLNTANGLSEIAKVMPNFKESSRYLCADDLGNYWVSHPLHGVFKIAKENGSYKAISFNKKSGLPDNSENYAFNIAGRIVVASSKGLFNYNENRNDFKADPVFKKIAGDIAIRFLKMDQSGNLWFVSGKQLAVIANYFSQPKLIFINELKDKILSGFESIETFDNQNILVGGIEGFYHLNFEKYLKKKNGITAIIGRVTTTNYNDSVVYNGLNLNKSNINDQTIVLDKNLRSLRFQFGTNNFASIKNAEYSYRLEGFENDWSIWSKRTEKEYTNLKPGLYTFLVKARDGEEQKSSVSKFEFKISPFWYETKWAKFFYVLLGLFALYVIRILLKRKLVEQRKKHKEEQNRLRYIFQLEKDKKELEITSLQNEKLASDIEHKNAELASSAMHLVKKGELLNRLQGQILDIDKQMKSPQLTAATKKIISSLREDKHLDEEWGIFSSHFDTVHTDFTKHLKQTHPNLTNNEVKLCINLRMNLSTKEIAQLMNISIRGVEVGRYRLRKKLGLESEVSFYDYLTKI